jgi:hypothetical protein
MSNQTNPLLPLAGLLAQCSSRDGRATSEIVGEAWDELRQVSFKQMDEPSSAVIAAVMINNKVIGEILAPAEHKELLRLARLAQQRYQERTNPPNKVGNLIAGILKEQ